MIQRMEGAMSTQASWQIAGQYMETCNCAYLCPCITSNLADTPTEGDCKAALAFRIDHGHRNGVTLDGVSFVVMLLSPEAMGKGNFTVGVIIDDRASDAQAREVEDIAFGRAGGPMGRFAPLTTTVAGVERRRIDFEMNGLARTVRAGELLSQTCEGVPSRVKPGEPTVIDNTGHPANARLGLARAKESRFDAFGIRWSDTTGKRNGHLAPFAWSN